MLSTTIASSCPSRRQQGTSWGLPLPIDGWESASVKWGTMGQPSNTRPCTSRLLSSLVGGLGGDSASCTGLPFSVPQCTCSGHSVEEQRALATLGRTYLMQSEEEEGEGEEERGRESLLKAGSAFLKSLDVCDKLVGNVSERWVYPANDCVAGLTLKKPPIQPPPHPHTLSHTFTLSSTSSYPSCTRTPSTHTITEKYLR